MRLICILLLVICLTGCGQGIYTHLDPKTNKIVPSSPVPNPFVDAGYQVRGYNVVEDTRTGCQYIEDRYALLSYIQNTCKKELVK